MIVNIKNTSPHDCPSYATAGSAGVDIRAFVTEEFILSVGARALIPTGLFVAIPEGYELQMRPRSGLAVKHGITCLNSPGTIDSDYRGELKVLLINLGQEDFVIKNGDRIAQMVAAKVERIHWQEQNELEETERGHGGFGHTGTK